MRFLPICISVLLLAAGAGCSAYLLERLRSSHISLAILGVVLTFALLAYFATRSAARRRAPGSVSGSTVRR